MQFKIWFSFFYVFFATAVLSAQQVPSAAIYYEGVLSGAFDSWIDIRIGLLDGEGVLVYQEEHSTQTDLFGGFSVAVGQGRAKEGFSKDFASIDWSISYRLKAEWRAKSGGVFLLLEEIELLSVPYAFYAFSSGDQQGVSAYEEWLSAGNTGSVEDYLESFRGPKGEKGTKGDPGSKGEQGEKGLPGFLPPGGISGAGVYWSGEEWVTDGAFFVLSDESMALGEEIVPLAQLALSSEDKGFLPPRMRAIDRDAIPNPAEGLIIFNLDSGCPNYYSMGNWWDWCGRVGLPAAQVDSLFCSEVVYTGKIIAQEPLENVYCEIPYTGGNKGIYSTAFFASNGAEGLVAQLIMDTISENSGWVKVWMDGVADEAIVSKFTLDFAGKVCTLRWEVEEPVLPDFPEGTLHCNPNVPTRPINVLSPHTGRLWMDRNMGAFRAAIASSDDEAAGDVYQWGRFSDGHQCRNSAFSSVLATTDRPTGGTFILVQNTPYDWRNPGNDNLWQGILGTNNPCPKGYRIPTEAEWTAEIEGWSSQDGKGALSSSLQLPLPGYRSFVDGAVLGQGIYGYYWTSNIQGEQTKVMMLSEAFSLFIKVGKAYGMSVRCIKD
jgi:uncharacterized protein (TIGR02145 family)